jgi:hypothetical protein
LRGQFSALSADGRSRIVSDAGDDHHVDRSQLPHPDVDRLSIEQPVRFRERMTRAVREARRVCAA